MIEQGFIKSIYNILSEKVTVKYNKNMETYSKMNIIAQIHKKCM